MLDLMFHVQRLLFQLSWIYWSTKRKIDKTSIAKAILKPFFPHSILLPSANLNSRVLNERLTTIVWMCIIVAAAIVLNFIHVTLIPTLSFVNVNIVRERALFECMEWKTINEYEEPDYECCRCVRKQFNHSINDINWIKRHHLAKENYSSKNSTFLIK